MTEKSKYSFDDFKDLIELLEPYTLDENPNTTRIALEQLKKDLDIDDELFNSMSLTDAFYYLLSVSREAGGLKNLNLVQYPNKYDTSTDSFINNIALYDPDDIKVPIRNNSDEMITGVFVIDDIEGLPSQITNENLMFLEGACNLYLNNITHFTPEILYRFSVGRPDARVTEKQKQQAIDSVERMATIRQEINLTPYVKQYGNKEAKNFIKEAEGQARTPEEANEIYVIKSYMLPIEEVIEKVQGMTQRNVYKLIKAPALLEYNEWLAKKRIGKIDAQLLDVLSTSVEDSLIKRYLAKRLIALENPNNNITNPHINLETLYKHIDVVDPNKKKRQNIREKALAVLDYWKAIDRISGYELIKTGRTITSVKLDYVKYGKAQIE